MAVLNKQHQISCKDEEWAYMVRCAAILGISVSTLIRRCIANSAPKLIEQVHKSREDN